MAASALMKSLGCLSVKERRYYFMSVLNVQMFDV